jgi:nitrate/TMAO reductase-like tetraheme cytochrome c subunit
VWALALGFSARAHVVAAAGPAPHVAGRIGPTPATGSPPESPQAPARERQAGTSAEPPAPGNDDCLACHEDTALTRANGASVHVSKEAFAASVHGPMNCVDCHADLAHATEFPHPEKLAKVDCASCHADQVASYNQSTHAQARTQGNGVAATCADCHGMHDIRGSKDPQSRTYHLNVAATCAKCHGSQEVIAKGKIAIGDVTKAFEDSIHGRALSRSGLLVAPTCSDCHGAHDILRKSDPRSHVALANVPATCGKCHEGIEHQFEGSVHAQRLAQGNSGVPACQTCHTPHAIQRTDNADWQLSVVNQCGSCHVEKAATYRDTFHGQVTKLGFRAVATCADCHSNHGILPASDPRSPIAPGNRLQTCRKCHPGATANFIKYDPHADKHDRRRNPMLYFTAKFMQVLLTGTFAFFGLHTVLWGMRTARPNGKNGRKGGARASAD